MKPAEKTYTFYKGEELLAPAARIAAISEIMLRGSCCSPMFPGSVHAELMETLATMRTRAARHTEELSSVSGLTAATRSGFSGYAGRALMAKPSPTPLRQAWPSWR